jgi:hypothetical protein
MPPGFICPCNGRAPRLGEVVVQADLARTFATKSLPWWRRNLLSVGHSPNGIVADLARDGAYLSLPEAWLPHVSDQYPRRPAEYRGC